MKIQLLLGSTFAGVALSNDAIDEVSVKRNSRRISTRRGQYRDQHAILNTNSHSIEVSSEVMMQQTKLPFADPLKSNPRDLRLGGRSRPIKGGRGGKSGKSSSLKSGKSGKSSGDVFYVAPFSCPNHCIDADGANFKSGAFDSAMRKCDNDKVSQQWIVHQDGTFVKLESVTFSGYCISIDWEMSDGKHSISDVCDAVTTDVGDNTVGSELILGSCDSHTSSWYFTGGQLLSAFCWTKGYSASMGASLSNANGGDCSDDLRVWGGSSLQLWREDIFMFIAEDTILAGGGGNNLRDDDYYYLEPTLSPTLSPSLSPTLPPNKSP